MVKFCVFLSCNNKQTKKSESFDHFQFHSFPVKRPDVLEKWIEAVGRGDSWKPGKASRVCSAHFAPECFKVTSGPRKLLHADAVPTINSGSAKAVAPRAGINKTSTTPFTKIQMLKLQYNQKIKELKRRNKIFKLRICRRDARIKELRNRLSSFKSTHEYKSKGREACERLEGFAKELIDHSMRNCDTKRSGIRYSSALREFALTLYLHSPRAYLYVRSLLKLLPNPSLIKKWIANFNRPPPDTDIATCNIITTDDMVTEAPDLTTTEELIIDDIDSFIVIEDPVNLQSCISGVAADDATTVDSIPLVVAQHIQIHSSQT